MYEISGCSGLMKDGAALPERLLDINSLPNMARIEALPGGSVRIGALARMVTWPHYDSG
jgi:CO/xanthine dehydrogenase FAD-binding subunit